MTDGTIKCPIDEFPDVWAQFKTSGYPFSPSKTLDEPRAAEISLEIILRYVVAWRIIDIDGNEVSLPDEVSARQASMMDNVDEVLATWLVKAFYENRAEIIKSKNSLPPSPKAS